MKTYTLDQLNKRYEKRSVHFYLDIAQVPSFNWKNRAVPEYQINGISGVVRENFENLEMINKRIG